MISCFFYAAAHKGKDQRVLRQRPGYLGLFECEIKIEQGSTLFAIEIYGLGCNSEVPVYK